MKWDLGRVRLPWSLSLMSESAWEQCVGASSSVNSILHHHHHHHHHVRGVRKGKKTTPNTILSVTCYLELRNAISIYYVFHILPPNVELVVWTSWNINIFTRLKKYKK